MQLTKTTITMSALAAGAVLALAAPLSASAHVSADPTETAAGSYTVLTFALSHGCDAAATTALTIDIPEGIVSVTPTVNPNWDVARVPVDLATPIDDGHGNSITERTGQIVYTAKTPLADGLRDTVALSLKLPEDAAGETLEFPVLQSCETGETNWNETVVEGEAEPEHPAPAITVTEATGDEHGHAATAGDEHSETDAAAAAATGATSAGESSDDVLARVLGIGGLVVGAVGVTLAVSARRKTSA